MGGKGGPLISFGQILFAALGAAYSIFIPGGWLLWAAVGYGLGSFLDPPDWSPTYGGPRGETCLNTVREGIPIPIAYGLVKTGGNIIRVNDPDEEFLKVAIGICQGEIGGFYQIWINDVLWGDLEGTENVDYSKTEYLGTFGQTADTTRWGSDPGDRASAFRGLAYISMTFTKNDQVGSAPTIKTTIYGKQCMPIGGGYLVKSGTFQWTASGSGTNEYYVELDGGGDPGWASSPDGVVINGVSAKEGLTLGSLAAGEWGYGNNDSLGFNTVYVRLLDGTDPDTKDDGYVRYTDYTRNPAIILYDFLATVEGYSPSELDSTSFTALSSYCSATPTGGTIERYRFDYVFDVDTPIPDAKKIICSSFHGKTVWSQGKIKVVYERDKSSSHDFTLDNIVKGSFSWKQPPKYNVVRIHFLNSADSYKEDMVEVKDRADIEDNGEYIFEQKCYYITDAEIARRRCRFLFDRFKYTNYTCELTGFPDSQDVELLDVVTVTHSLPGWESKSFIVTARTEDQFGRVSFALDAYHAGVYGDKEIGSQVGYTSTLPNPFDAPDSCTSLSLTEHSWTNKDGIYTPVLLLTYTRPANQVFWNHANIYLRISDSTGIVQDYTYYGSDYSGGTNYLINGATADFKVNQTVSAKVRSVNDQGVEQPDAGSPTTSCAVTGQMLTPSVITGLALKGAVNSGAGDDPYEWDGTRFILVWRGASTTGGFGQEIYGQEVLNFGGAPRDPIFSHDEMEFWVGGTRRAVFYFVNAHQYEYIWGDQLHAFLDDYVVAANGTVTIKIRRWTIFNKHSDWASITITHKAPTLPSVNTDFNGRDCSIWWEPIRTPDFKEYKIQVYSDAGRAFLLRTEYTTDPRFMYTWEMNYEDNSASPIDTIYFTVTAYNIFDQTDSEDVTGGHLFDTIIADLTCTPVLAGMIKLKWTEPASGKHDVAGYNVYIDENPAPVTLVAFVKGNTYVYTGNSNTLYYIKVMPVDSFGNEGTAYAVQSVTTSYLSGTEIDFDVPLTQDITWSSDATDISWTGGTLNYKGVVYTINSGSGSSSDPYVYWDLNDAPTTFHTSATRPTLGLDKWLMAYYDQPNDAIYPANAHKIIHGGLIQASSITATEINVTQLSAIAADLGTITAGTFKTGTSGQRIEIDGSANTLTFYDSSAEVIKLDDNIYGSTPGMAITSGAIYMFNDTYDYIILRHATTGSIYAINDSDSTLVDTEVITGEVTIPNTGGDGNSKYRRSIRGSAAISKATNSDHIMGISGTATTIGTGDAYGGYFSAGATGGGTAYAGFFEGGQVYITNELKFDATTGEFHIPRVSASAQPTPTAGELQLWRDPDDNKTYLIYNDTDEGVRKIELT